ncbi:MAG: hypothetical protein IMZ66_03060, partial [Planctomycetes bacterium]|nr:hypothetical protein [Planctomycetota bacterium]
MSEEGKAIQGIEWRRYFAALDVLRSFRMAIHPANLLLCFLGLAASFVVAVSIDEVLPAPVGQTEVYGASFLQHARRIVTTTLWGDWSFPYVDGKTWDHFFTFLMAPVNAGREFVVLAIAYWKKAPWFALLNT